MPSGYDQGKEALDELIQWAEANDAGDARNEATTRLHLIDTLLMGVLGWPKSQIRAEEPAGTGRIDYSLGAPAVRLIIEAKKEGVYFDLPAGTRTGVHSLRSLTDGPQGKALTDALQQVSTYAAVNGVGLAGVTNGHQLILFVAVRTDGIKPLDGRALVFPTLADMRTEYRSLWDNTSPAGIDSRRLYASLRTTNALPPEPLAVHIPGYPGVKRRNDLQTGLQILGELFFLDVARLEELREDFLKDSYASSGALSQYSEVSKQILQTRYAMLNQDAVQVSPAVERLGLSQELTQDVLAAAASGRPIVLLGDVGVGKSTFIQRLVHVDAKEIFDDSISIYVDFGVSTTLSKLDTFVMTETARQLSTHYHVDVEDAGFVEAVHHGALNRFERTVVGRLRDLDPLAYEKEKIRFLQDRTNDRAGHLQKSLEHLRSSWRKQIVVFLDNIDQRSGTDQEQVFLIANELASSWPVTVFVTLRPETFYASTRIGALSGYQPRVFTISPPRTDVMLQKRFAFVLKQLEETGRLGSFPIGVTVDSDSLQAFLEVLANNCQSNTKLLALIDNLAGGNMRLALQFVTDFIGSGHINTRKIIDAYRESGAYTIPVHEFLRALLYGDGEHFEPEASPIPNLFNVSQPDGREHFLLPLLLSEVQVQGDRFAQDGFVSSDHIFKFGQSLGFDADQVASSLDRATHKRLLESAPRYVSDEPRLHYRITTVGAYTNRVLVQLFSYLDAVLVDTPIMDAAYRGLIKDVRYISERLPRAEYFRIYLDKQWAKLDTGQSSWDWPRVSSKLSSEIRDIGRKVDPESWKYD